MTSSQQQHIAPARLPRAGGGRSSLPHVHQLYNWDCGLACVLMVLQGGAAPLQGGMVPLQGRTPAHTSALDLATLRRFCPVTRCTYTLTARSPAVRSKQVDRLATGRRSALTSVARSLYVWSVRRACKETSYPPVGRSSYAHPACSYPWSGLFCVPVCPSVRAWLL